MLLSLTNEPRDYAWGSTTLLAELEGREPTTAPEAEVWFGDHPSDPADLTGGRTLDAVTGGSLPYLLKLLAAAAPLSIQVHPTIEQARAGWEREAELDLDDSRRNYHDANHKPELIVSLSERFEALSGLRPVADTVRLLELLGESRGIEALRSRVREIGDPLRTTIGWLLTDARASEIADMNAAVRRRAFAESGEWTSTLRAVADVAERYPEDPGAVVALLMNHVVLRRGEGIFLPAGQLHAYLGGLGVEIMATSDNVLRGGLTPKRIDVPELLSIVDTAPRAVRVIRPSGAGPMWAYDVPVTDFSLRRIELDGGELCLGIGGPTMVLVTAGSMWVSGQADSALPVPVGTAVFATPDEGSVTITGVGEAFIAEPG